MQESLRQRLISLAQNDRLLRAELAVNVSLSDGYHPRMRVLHEENAQALEEIRQEHGWPGRSLAGEDGAEAAWLILQHAIGRPDLLRRSLPLLEQASKEREIPPWQPAYLLDRIRYFEGKPQVYGTQFEQDAQGLPQPWPTEDPEHLNERRRSVGLDSVEERTQKMQVEFQAEGDQAPVDREKWQRKYGAWSKETGWRD